MNLPFFFLDKIDLSQDQVSLDEETSKHLAVLRMKEGEKILLTDGRGGLLECSLDQVHKKHAQVKVLGRSKKPREPREVTIAISLLKNNARFEWFLEKATELGINTIIPLICNRTEKQKFR